MTYFIIGLIIGLIISYVIARSLWPGDTTIEKPDMAIRAHLVAAEGKIARLEAELAETLELRERLAGAELEITQLETLLAVATARRPTPRLLPAPTRLFGSNRYAGRFPA